MENGRDVNIVYIVQDNLPPKQDLPRKYIVIINTYTYIYLLPIGTQYVIRWKKEMFSWMCGYGKNEETHQIRSFGARIRNFSDGEYMRMSIRHTALGWGLLKLRSLISP